jgi:hypothetical protein
LYDEEENSDASSQRNDVEDERFNIDKNVESLTDKIVNDLVHADDIMCKEVDDKIMENMEIAASVERHNNVTGLEAQHGSPISVNKMAALYEQQLERVHSKSFAMPVVIEKLRSAKGTVEMAERDASPIAAVNNKAGGDVLPPKGCPIASRSYVKDQWSLGSGPWSVDWLRNIQKGGVGLISSKTKQLRMVGKESSRKCASQRRKGTKKKAGGALRHPMVTLKKVARLPSKDREEVMKALRGSKAMKELNKKITSRKRQREKVLRSLEATTHNSNSQSASVTSVNNDWTNWVVLRGHGESKVEDIQGIGRTIGISFNGNNHNKFSILSRPKGVGVGPILSPVEVERGEVEEDE